MPGELRWYSIDPSLATLEHDPVSLDQALEIARSRYANAGRTYENAEDAVADTMFGFFRDEKTFLELCINAPSSISLRFETPRTGGSWLSRLANSAISIEKTLGDSTAMESAITAFFSMPAEQFARHIGA